mgnify:FL=1
MNNEQMPKTGHKEIRGMIFVEGGLFDMGSNDGESDELPVHKVFVNSFWIDKNLVTVKEYFIFCGSTGKEFPTQPDWEFNELLPVVNVSWQDALDYSKWVGKRLPTEAEWEFASKAGVKCAKFKYSGSDNPADISWFARNSESPMLVGTKLPNCLGIFDLSGNVWEWTNDWYDPEYYRIRTENNPRGPVNGTEKVLRGGSFFNDSYLLRNTNRHKMAPKKRNSMTGFRCVKSL